MHPLVHANLVGIESLLDVPATLGKPNKRWHLAFTTIYCSRTIYSLSRKPVVRKKPSKISSSPSYTTLNINLDTDHFKIHQSSLSELVKKKDLDHLEKFGGIVGIAHAIGTDMDVASMVVPRTLLADNKHLVPTLEAFKDLTIFILLGCAALSLGCGIKEHGLKEGWYDGGSIFVAVFLVIAVSAISNYRQNRQFDKLSKISDNMKIDVVRSRRRQTVSIFELVVGDVVCLKIGDQVPADGLFIDGHSLQIDESSMTGESDHVENQSHKTSIFGLWHQGG
uniref:P-type ATPase A domain-containing protein n=1 Tax=Salix viminalis TaxID=40686 RepID=A0A6N2MKI1_SALVM